jgi:sucrose phosphorylase
MLALEGIPAFYIHSLLATGNDYIAVERSGRLRTINRHRWSREALDAALRDPMQHHGRVFSELRRLIRIRRAQPAFHPNATQFTLHLGTQVFAFWRQSQVRDQSIFCINNITADWQRINLADINLIQTELWVDLISGDCVTDFKGALELAPYQCVWLSNRGADGPELADV